MQLGEIVYDGPPTGLTAEVLTKIYGEEDWSATIRKVDDEAEADGGDSTAELPLPTATAGRADVMSKPFTFVPAWRETRQPLDSAWPGLTWRRCSHDCRRTAASPLEEAADDQARVAALVARRSAPRSISRSRSAPPR